MRSLIIGLCITIITSLSNRASGQEIIYADSTDGICLKFNVGNPALFHNLAQFKCMSRVTFPDSSAASKIISEAGKTIGKKISAFDDVSKWAVRATYSMMDHKDIVFLMLTRPFRMDHRYTVAWNRSQNRYYLLGMGDLDSYNILLSTEEVRLFSDFEFLEYSWLIASLRNPTSNILFISSIKEILIEAIFKDPMSYDLSTFDEATADIVKLPSVRRSWWEGPGGALKLRPMIPITDTVVVNFFMVKNTYIMDVTITFTGQEVIRYKEDMVETTIYWFDR